MHIYDRIGIRRIINADARLTRLGGSLMSPAVTQAMAEAARGYVDLHELQRAVGRRLAELTNNEGAYVCTGAAAGLFLATLACMAGSDPEAYLHLPRGDYPKREVILHTAHRMSYDPAVRLAGAVLRLIGAESQTDEADLEEALTPHTAAVLYVAGEHRRHGALPLETVIAMAHRRGIPVIVDAAAQLPPPENLWHFTRDLGADLAIFSGGKDLCGPQASGMILGRADLIAACTVQGAPNARLGRPMKVGKEELIGLLTAVEQYLRIDHTARAAQCEAAVAGWIAALADLPGVQAQRTFPNEAGQPLPRLRIDLDVALCGLDGEQLRQQLWEGEPGIAVAQAGACGVSLTADTLEPGEERVIAERLRAILTHGRISG